jgi:DNA-binding MarR family transcriptional regulator
VSDSDTASRDNARALSRLASLVSAICDESGLSLRQYRTLAKLVDRPLRASALARLLGTTRATLSTAIRKLESRGLVRRGPAEDDERGVTIEITPAGRAAVALCEEHLTRLVAGLSTMTQPDQLGEVLEQLQQPIEREATNLKMRIMSRGQGRDGSVEPSERRGRRWSIVT